MGMGTLKLAAVAVLWAVVTGMYSGYWAMTSSGYFGF
jgi:hypothetical protein